MMLEMAAFRLATVYFGSSLFVWANIIGLVMTALAIGYYFGGKLADLYPQRKTLMLIVLFSGIVTSFVPLLSNAFLFYFKTSPSSLFFDSLILSSFLFVAILFILPLTLLGVVSPFAIRLENERLETTGRASGSIYAFSTAGSIFGTFFSSFLLIPFWGTKETILFSSFCLILIGLIGLGKDFKKIFLFFLVFPLFLGFFSPYQRENLVYEKESLYGLVQVIEDKDLGYILDLNQSGARWSVYHPDKILTGMYFDYFTPLAFLLEEKKDMEVLIIGHAGGVTSRQYSHFFEKENPKIDGVEIDPEVSRAAFKFFDLKSQKGLKVINEDGRTFLQKSEKTYDLIFIDAYIDNLYIPFQLATKEFFKLTESRLKNEGVLAIMALSRNPEKEMTFQSLFQTIKSVYPYVFYFPSAAGKEHFILASNNYLLKDNLSNIEERTDIEELKKISSKIAENFKEELEIKTKRILTDNQAPLEMLRELDFLFFLVGS